MEGEIGVKHAVYACTHEVMERLVKEGRGGEGRGEEERGGEGRERSDECLYCTNFQQWCVSTSLDTTAHMYLHTYVSTSVVPIHTYTLTNRNSR